MAASFAAGALAVSAVVMLAGSTASTQPARAISAREAAAVEWAAIVRAQTPSEVPREWRQEFKPLRLDGMYRKQR